MELPSLADMSSAELIQLVEDAQTAYATAIEREQLEAATAQRQLLQLAQQLGGLLGPEEAPAGTSSLRAAQRLPDDRLLSPEVTRLLLRTLAELTQLATASVQIGAAEAGR